MSRTCPASRSPDIDDDVDADDIREIPFIDLSEIDETAAGPVPMRDNFQAPRPKKQTPSSINNLPPIAALDVLIKSYRSPIGVIRPGDSLELKDKHERHPDRLHSGDVIRVKQIIKNLATDEVRFRGLRFRRAKYMGRFFDCKYNEMVLDLQVDEDDPRPDIVKGMVEIPSCKVLRKRELIVTDKPYPMLSFRENASSMLFPSTMLTKDIIHQTFNEGRLVCRTVNILNFIPNGKAYSGVVRQPYKSEIDTLPPRPQSRRAEIVARTTANLRGSKMSCNQLRSAEKRRHSRSPSVEELPEPPQKAKAKANLRSKNPRYPFCDVFCGAGGASQGAADADWDVVVGLDFEKNAMKAWRRNNPMGKAFCRDATGFPMDEPWMRRLRRMACLHMSVVCKTFSSAYTVKGKDHDANLATLYMVGPAVKFLKPRIISIENTSGLHNIPENRKYFEDLVKSIINGGREEKDKKDMCQRYNVRYKIVNMADYGLPQERKRLLIIAAKIGTPLPPFPKPTHGPTGSGLKRFVSVKDALAPLDKLSQHVRANKWHQPHKAKRVNKQPYDASTTLLQGCITTSGTTHWHPDGKRAFTILEIALLQGLPINYHLEGSNTDATRQVGNMYPPVMAEKVFRLIAQTLEAFDFGLIDADDEIEDLNVTLIEKGFDIPEQTVETPASYFDLTSPPCNTKSPYRYLRKPQISDAAKTGLLSPWARRKIDEPSTRIPRTVRQTLFPVSESEAENVAELPIRSNKRRRNMTDREKLFWAEAKGEVQILSD